MCRIDGWIRPVRNAYHPRWSCFWNDVCLWGGNEESDSSLLCGSCSQDTRPLIVKVWRSGLVSLYAIHDSSELILVAQRCVIACDVHVVRWSVSSCSCWQCGHLACSLCFHFFITTPVGRHLISHLDMKIGRWCLVSCFRKDWPCNFVPEDIFIMFPFFAQVCDILYVSYIICVVYYHIEFFWMRHPLSSLLFWLNWSLCASKVLCALVWVHRFEHNLLLFCPHVCRFFEWGPFARVLILMSVIHVLDLVHMVCLSICIWALKLGCILFFLVGGWGWLSWGQICCHIVLYTG